MPSRRFTIQPRGRFDLFRSIAFLEEWPAARKPADDVLRFSFCAEGDWRPVGVRVSQDGDQVEVEATGPGHPVEDLPDQVARILSLDIDGAALDGIAHHDPAVADLIATVPGLRPVCFWTPWEAACWAVLSQRTSMRTASALKQRIARELGSPVVVDGREQVTFPGPGAIRDASTLPGVNPVKTERLHGLAEAALDGTLTARALRAVEPEDALAALRELPGVGPFSAALILIRGAGAPDVLPLSEPRLLTALRQAYHLPETAADGDYQAIAENWRPLRSWVSFLFRATY
jgi:DNA-3-methyladenine glycosylase II